MGFFVLIVIGFFVFLSVTSARTAHLNSIYRRLAARYQSPLYNAQFHRGSILSLPYLRFVYNDAHVLVDMWYSSVSSGFASYTQFHISWPDHELALKVRPATWRDRVKRRIGSQHVRLQNQYYDQRYQVEGNSPEPINAILTGGALSVVDQLVALGNRDDISIEIADGILVIRKRGIMRDFMLLRRFAALGVELFDQAMISRMHGIDIIDEQYEVEYNSDATCKICGELIESDIVYCMKCNTPHHRECWDYYGSCSVYGCGESRCRHSVQV